MLNFCSSAYTSKGFVDFDFSNRSAENFLYIIKGYPQAVKTQIFDLIETRLSSQNINFYIRQDFSLHPVALVCDERQFEICDGTYPYNCEPLSYGAFDKIIDISAFQNGEELKKKAANICELLSQIQKSEHRAVRFLSAAAGVKEDCKKAERKRIDQKKLNRFSSKLWSKYGERPNGHIGIQKKIFDVSSQKSSTLFENCDRVIVINDFFGAVAQSVTEKIRAYALSSGIDVISVMNICDPYGAPEHVLVPSIGLGVFTKSKNCDICPYGKGVNASRFYQREKVGLEKNRLSFGKKAFWGLIEEANKSIEEIEKIRSLLDDIYMPLTDNDALTGSVLNTVLGSD